jgi:RNA polymerase sigma factor (sigma-70 family)
MATAQIQHVVKQLRKVLAPREESAASDWDLLERFAASRDETAFEVVVWRHHRMVLSVCSRILADSNDVEDAFQATFVVLARKAGSLRRTGSLSSWLFGVARRVALDAGGRSCRHLSEHVSVASASLEPCEELIRQELRYVFDEALGQLPEKYRAPIVMCYLEGLTYEEAGEQLGWPKGTVSTRLTRARELLRKRLAGRGLAVSAAPLAAWLCASAAPAAVPASLVTSTIKVATSATATGAKTVAGTIAPKVAALTEGVLKAMFMIKLKKLTAVIVLLALAAFGGGLATQHRAAGQQGDLDRPAAKEKSPHASAPKTEPKQPRESREPSSFKKLVNRLTELRPKAGEDEWAEVLRDLIQLGPKAAPELIAELDATQDEFMLRCLGFVARGIGDKRVIPALIRALPKTCVTARSDYGFIAKDPELLAFMQKHDRDKEHNGTHYSFGRAVNEITFTLQKLAGVKHGEDEIIHVFLQGTPRQQVLQRSLYQRCAERWAKWWEAHWKEHVADERCARVNLRPLADDLRAVSGPAGFPHGPQAKIAEQHANHILQSVRNPKARFVFLDLDTGRETGLPERLRAPAGEPERLDDIRAWAAREGFDLMGTEYLVPGEKKPHYVLRGLGLRLWQIETERWKTLERELSNAPFNMGTRTDGLLAHFDAARGRYLPEETATFLFQTREGGYGAIFVGVEVHDDSLQPGGFATGQEELSPVAFFKGRRFAYSVITGPDGVGNGIDRVAPQAK